MSAYPADAETGFYDRASQDSELIRLLGTKESGRARIYPGYPPTPISATEAPRLTFFAASDFVKVRGMYQVRIQVDEWVWPTGDEGGEARIADIDARLLDLFDEQSWQHDGARLYAIALSGRRIPTAADRALRRIREFQISVSPA